MFYRWKPYVPSAERRRQAARAVARFKKKGATMMPVVLDGRAMAKTFWGKAWCDNLERYSDYSNRLPRGRTYVRNGSVIDLKIAPGELTALVSGSSIYTVRAQITAVPKVRWKAVCADCAGAIDSLVELLQGRFSKGVMERICRQDTGLFPSPKEISFTCSCPDWATMCKHVAAVLYGVGARLDQNPELLFALRKVDHNALVATAGRDLSLGGKGPATGKVLEEAGLAEMFGIELVARTEGPASAGTAKEGANKKSSVAIGGRARSKKLTPMPKKTKATRSERVAAKAGKHSKPSGPRSSRRGRG
ncbi:MAG: hypothetical protein OEP48_10855 [Betaproteobacteria bacterium]|nr:hypothetical protein [Betaproteobacteria bacterium]MDH3436887.1 hypothetical protein [Betaproteobacteria bacterium]